ncbi:uncharacterized protein [Prorops nasuta]|uniref:uncharacterized protein n=1 Tax=Prorops nasuta TaxID=863751 RepID=UPI0034D01ACB
MNHNGRARLILQKRITLKTQITILTNTIDNDRLDNVNVKLRFERISDHFKNYEELHDELMILEPNGDHLEEMLEVQDRFYSLASKVDAILKQINSSTPNHSGNSNYIETSQNERVKRIKLPIAQLPKFSGEIESWLSYKNTFITMIDLREDITDLQKFLYLKDSLKGEALNKINIYDTSDASYKLAWNLLIETYEKRRIIIAKHLDAILDMPAQERNGNLELTQIVDNMKQHVNMLAALDICIDEIILIRILERSLPLNIRSRWEESLKLDEIPSLKQLYDFVAGTAFRIATIEKEKLRKRASNSCEQRHHSKIRKQNIDARIMLSTTQEEKCSICQEEKHVIFRCPVYNKMNVNQRWDNIRRLRLCQNCLRAHSNDCRSIKCRSCNRFHHTSLHRNRIREEPRHSLQASLNQNTSTEGGTQGGAG